MTARYSTGLRNAIAGGVGLKNALSGGVLQIYTGAQPASPDAAVTGTLLCQISADSGAFTPETPSSGTATYTGTAGSIDEVTVNGTNILPASVPFTSTLANTVALVAASINAGNVYPGYRASASGDVLTITARQGAGAAPNGLTVSGSATTVGATYTNMASGVSQVNGLQFSAAGDINVGQIEQLAGQIWSGVNQAAGTAGWFRFVGSNNSDTGQLDTTGAFCRLDGAIATSGGEMNLNSTVFTSGATTTIQGFTATMPGQ